MGERFPHELSSGQGQLFRLALTWFRPARLLILDEPEQRLDTDRRVMVGDLVRARCATGTTVLMACHDPALTASVADEVVDVGGPRMTAAEQRAEDKARLEDITHVLHGPARHRRGAAGAVRRVPPRAARVHVRLHRGARPVHHERPRVAARPAARARAPRWWPSLLAVALTALVHGLGRRRGPVVPPLPWVDHVVAGPLDRAATLREWWLVSATLLVAGATVFAGVLGGGLWASGTTGPTSLVVALVVGPALGVVVAAAWLAGQVGAGGRGPTRCRRPTGARTRAPRARPVRRAPPPRADRAARPEHPLHAAGRRGARGRPARRPPRGRHPGPPRAGTAAAVARSPPHRRGP